MSDESKFDFSEDEQQQVNKDKAVEEKKEAIKQDAKGLFSSISTFLSELLDFRDDTDREATIEAIKADIPFKGATAWILICSIMVASVGLNANSTAVVIGAMLISPLMGPILGIGMSIAVNDIDSLKKSLINLATMIVLSLITAYVFFRFFPLGTASETSELLGRTKPDIRDVLIAFFGGLALIIARTKKGTIASVIFGVAIATALMPPLCTAGYSLAKGNWVFFGGAMNLFTINTIFIALATFIVLKVLRFPMLKYANSKKRKRIAQIASLVAIGVMIWPTLTFINVYKESIFNNQAKTFIETKVEPLNAQLFDEDYSYEDQVIELTFLGEINDQTKQLWNNELASNPNFDKLRSAKLRIKGSDTQSYELITNAYNDTRDQLKESRLVISGLQDQITELNETISGLNQQLETQNSNNEVAFSSLAKDVKIKFNDLNYFGYAKMLESKDFIKIDTISVANIKWNSNLNDSLVLVKEGELLKWLKDELKTEKVRINRN
ncbi:DUF389 domain-containing protein [uncultured Winogradskyella sp.]|uniref:DUF389 domain-containing protein n=1 Tax=uncultured Winogradskyella sp. TaxID=395353 RepID=UPI002613ED46|nr:DUF389 domain-containing protein [uncultured Winogradskyella sp.]